MKYLVLLVEDEKRTGEFLKKALETENIQTEWVRDGHDAIQKMEKGKFDLVILDMKLPELSGDEVLEKIRAIDLYVEVVVYTNYPTDSFEPAVIKKLFRHGVEDFINKGSDADLWEMVSKVKRILDPLSEVEREELLDEAIDHG